MQAVPSLIGSGAAIAAAASGLVFGQTPDADFASTTPFSNYPIDSRPPPLSHAGTSHMIQPLLPLPPPPPPLLPPDELPCHTHTQTTTPTDQQPSSSASASTITTTASNSLRLRPLSAHFSLAKVAARRHSFIRYSDFSSSSSASSPPITNADGGESVSSNGSWIRRLSIRPLSHHGGSARSSVGPDSASMNFSHTSGVSGASGAPILSPPPAAAAAPLLHPNKLVKRTSSTTDASAADTVPHRRTRPRLPIIRRPATSHQRTSVFYQPQQPQRIVVADTQQQQQQQQQQQESETPPAYYLLDRDNFPSRDPDLTNSVQISRNPATELSRLYSYMHSKVVNVAGRSGRSGRPGRHGRDIEVLGEGGLADDLPAFTLRRLDATQHKGRAHLTKPSQLATQPVLSQQQQQQQLATAIEPSFPCGPVDVVSQLKRHPDHSEGNLFSQARRAIPMQLSSPTTWISRTGGSIRRSKRSSEVRADAQRHASAPETLIAGSDDDGLPTSAEGRQRPTRQAIADSEHLSKARHRNSSPPLPLISRLSSFNIDLSRMSSGGGGSSGGGMVTGASLMPRQVQPSGSSQGSYALGRPTTTSSDAGTRCFTLYGDDDTDFKSETLFDSVRTGTSAKARNVESPLESMFDESPPSTAGHMSKTTRRLSIRETLGMSWHDDTRITEEEEGMTTPIRRRQGTATSPSSPPANAHDCRYRERESLDDDFDDDWARDDEDAEEHLSSPLSPPSKNSSAGRRGVSPNVRLALACISGNELPSPPDHNYAGSHHHDNRPLSSLFDWSEPFPLERNPDGSWSRPKTVHGKQDADRGGRSALRRGPATAHVRSQSVPVVPEATDPSGTRSLKFGTWGMTTQPVSEDWDDDFEFEIAGNGVGTESEDKAIEVPASIQASQPSIKAHCGQIREFSLIVNDLKRLLRRGRDLDVLQGTGVSLWKEAEGIIALASPDDDDTDDDGTDTLTETLAGFDSSHISERFLEDGFDGASLEDFASPKLIQEGSISKPEAVGERRSSARRRSVFSPDDDIFGGHWPLADDDATDSDSGRLQQREKHGQDKALAAVQPIMEALHDGHQSSQDRMPPVVVGESEGRVHFGTNSLNALVKRAGELRDALSELIRGADPVALSPVQTLRRCTKDSPAFTQMFTEPPPSSSSPRRLAQQSHGTMLSRSSIDVSPSSSIKQCMQMMTVS